MHGVHVGIWWLRLIIWMPRSFHLDLFVSRSVIISPLIHVFHFFLQAMYDDEPPLYILEMKCHVQQILITVGKCIFFLQF
jgi:hypothetical protein